MRIALLYGAFSVLAIALNIGAQDVVLRVWRGLGWEEGAVMVLLSIVAGTGVGLVSKYVLDKRYIFRFRAQSAAHDGQVFALYTAMGLLTTAVFWGFEYGFWLIFGTTAMRYTGGVIGLVIGYWCKYHLDKRFVFGDAGNAWNYKSK